MKLAVFDDFKLGVVRDGTVVAIDEVAAAVAGRPPQERLTYVIERFRDLRPQIERLATSGRGVPTSDVTFQPALPFPTKICCCAGNYKEHGTKTEVPLGMFLKSSNSVLGHGGTVELTPMPATVFHHEAELGVVIGRRARRVPAAEAMDYVFGYTLFIDVSARGILPAGFFAHKSFDTFGPVGPTITSKDEVPDPHQLQVRLWVNDELRQDYNTDDMGNQIPALVEYASAVTTLEPGDLIACGTNHHGLGPIQDGDVVRMTIDQLGELSVRVSDPLKRSWPRDG